MWDRRGQFRGQDHKKESAGGQDRGQDHTKDGGSLGRGQDLMKDTADREEENQEIHWTRGQE